MKFTLILSALLPAVLVSAKMNYAVDCPGLKAPGAFEIGGMFTCQTPQKTSRVDLSKCIANDDGDLKPAKDGQFPTQCNSCSVGQDAVLNCWQCRRKADVDGHPRTDDFYNKDVKFKLNDNLSMVDGRITCDVNPDATS